MHESIRLERVATHKEPSSRTSAPKSLSLDGPTERVHTELVPNQQDVELSQLQDLHTKKKQEAWSRVQLSVLFYCLFIEGWNDGTLGPLLPRIQAVYHVSFTVVSLIFVVTCVGVCVGTLINVFGTEVVGFGKLTVIGLSLQLASHCLQASGSPFPVFVLSYAIYGIGATIYVSQINGFVAALKKGKETKLGMLHCAYGLGAFAAPLVATQFSHMKKWNFYFLTSIGMAAVAVILAAAVFRLQKQDACLLEIGQLPNARQAESDRNNLRQIWSRTSVHVMTLFVFFYVGVEVTIGGWIVTYIIQTRGGGPSSGYISSGFFGGLALGRVALLWVTSKVGEKRAVFLYSGLALGLELVVWLVPSLVGDAIAVSIVGVLLGPFYPIALSYCSKIFPRWILTASIGWIAGLGQMGSAVLPFATGALANRFGITSLQPFLVGMMSCMVVMWAAVPSSTHRHD